jgi:predicted GNAT family N-acyltransferase
MKYIIALGDWAQHKAAAQEVRYDVFIVEQEVPVEMEWDEMDACSLHAIALDETGAAVGTGRLLPDGHIGRMAVRKQARGAGIGSALLSALMEAAAQRGDRSLLLHAQRHAEAFYRRFGFVREGEEFMEAGIPHVAMRCAI